MAEAATWKYVENQMDRATQGSRLATNQLIQDHKAKLTAKSQEPGADPRLAALLDDFLPIVDQWDKEYADSKNVQAQYGGKTVSLETLLANLVTPPGPEQASKIEDWDTRIRAQAPKGSSTYVMLLPQGRRPFSGTKRDKIISEVKNLATRLGEQSKPELVALGTEVKAYSDLLNGAREAQQGMEGRAATEADEITPARAAVMTAMYGNLGMLMHIYRENPVMITGFFDLNLLRKPTKKIPAAKTTAPPA